MKEALFSIVTSDGHTKRRIIVGHDGLVVWSGNIDGLSRRGEWFSLANLISALLPFASNEGKRLEIIPTLKSSIAVSEASLVILPNEGCEGLLKLTHYGEFEMHPEEQKAFRSLLSAAARDLVFFLVHRLNQLDREQYRVEKHVSQRLGLAVRK